MGREIGGRFKREGIYVHLGLIHVEVWQKTTKFCKAIILQQKINTFLKIGKKKKEKNEDHGHPSGPITSWQTDGEKLADFIFLGSKITLDGDRSHEIKRCLLLGRKAMTNLGNVFKNRDISLLTKIRRVKAMVFPVVTYGCENWTTETAEHLKKDTFE